MKDLIKALTIFESYNPNASTYCTHDVMAFCGVNVYDVSEKHKEELQTLGFYIGESWCEEAFESYRWGSC